MAIPPAAGVSPSSPRGARLPPFFILCSLVSTARTGHPRGGAAGPALREQPAPFRTGCGVRGVPAHSPAGPGSARQVGSPGPGEPEKNKARCTGAQRTYFPGRGRFQ